MPKGSPLSTQNNSSSILSMPIKFWDMWYISVSQAASDSGGGHVVTFAPQPFRMELTMLATRREVSAPVSQRMTTLPEAVTHDVISSMASHRGLSHSMWGARRTEDMSRGISISASSHAVDETLMICSPGPVVCSPLLAQRITTRDGDTGTSSRTLLAWVHSVICSNPGLNPNIPQANGRIIKKFLRVKKTGTPYWAMK